MGQSLPLFVYFCYFLITISIIQIEKSVDGVLGIQTWGLRMVGADKTTELWRPWFCYYQCTMGFLEIVDPCLPILQENLGTAFIIKF